FLACMSLVQQVREMRFGVVDVDDLVHAVEASPACWSSQLDSQARLGMVRTPGTTRLHAATARVAYGSAMAGQLRLAGPTAWVQQRPGAMRLSAEKLFLSKRGSRAGSNPCWLHYFWRALALPRHGGSSGSGNPPSSDRSLRSSYDGAGS